MDGDSGVTGGEGSVDTSTESADTSVDTGSSEGAGEGGSGNEEGAAPPAYTPNYKYKVTAPVDGGQASRQEKEIPDWARPFVTTAEIEKNVKELFEKSEGIEAVKQHRDVLTQQNEQMVEQWQPIVQNAQTMVEHLRRGDMDSFFEMLNIPEQTVLKYALYRLQLRENPGQLQAHEQQRQLQNQNLQLQQQVQSYTSNFQEMAVQQRSSQLDQQLSRPEILQTVQAFESGLGTPGRFRQECIRRGQAYAAQGQDVSAEQVVGEVAQLLGWQGQNTQAAQVQAQGGQQQGVVGNTTPKATFPSVKGKGTSPARRAITSTAQLRELARQI